MDVGDYSIGRLARQTGCKIQTIRYYEEIGLMPAPDRTSGNQRRYASRDLERLSFIRHSRQLGFSLDTIRQLLSLVDTPNQSCERADRIARGQLREIQSRIERLRALEVELLRMAEQCQGGQVADCRVIEVLRDHSQCLHDEHLPI